MNQPVKIATQTAQLRQQAQRMASLAWSLMRMAENISQHRTDTPHPVCGPHRTNRVCYEHDLVLVALAKQSLCERAKRSALFSERIFIRWGWDSLMILYRNRVKGLRTPLIALVNELECTARDIEDAIAVLVDVNLVTWCQRRHFLRLTEHGAELVREYFLDDAPLSMPTPDCIA